MASLATQLQRAAKALQNGRLQDAEALLKPLQRSAPNHADVLQLSGLLAKHQGRLRTAAAQLRRYADKAKTSAANTNLANTLAQFGASVEADRIYGRALKAEPQFRLARLGRARLAVQSERYALADSLVQPMLHQNSNDLEAGLITAQVAQGIGDWPAAVDITRRLLALNPDYIAARFTLASALLGNGELDAAQNAYQALADSPSRELALAGTARVLLARGANEAAEQFLTDALGALPQSPELHTLLAKLRYMLGQSGYAEAIDAAVIAHPSHFGLPLAAARIHRGAGSLALAQRVLTDALRSEPSWRDAYLRIELSEVLLELERPDDALEAARQADSSIPHCALAMSAVAQAALSAGEGREALGVAESLRQFDPNDQRYIAYFADACRLLGDSRATTWLEPQRWVRRYSLPVPPQWPNLAAFLQDLEQVLTRQHTLARAPLDQSLRGGTQTQTSLLQSDEPVVKALLESLNACVSEYLGGIEKSPDFPLSSRNQGQHRMTGCWSVKLGGTGFHVNHLHPQGWVSSAFYVSVPSEVSIDDPSYKGWLQFGQPRFAQPGADVLHREVPEAGTLVLFPSYLWHGTVPFESDEARLSVAFDAIPL